ncbi:factor of DNA methylation 4-like [Pistacia vera]|uniref:factor of DNA methylation 4-like n=1 Tax=Pistacia vera TaxID=55513 RepID=UPI00126330BC|nr:factor of DNA methylation 4-like [Pistacia vera]
MEELRKMMQDGRRDNFEKILLEIETVSLHLNTKEKELGKREKQLLHAEAQNEIQRTELHHNRRRRKKMCRNIMELRKKLNVENVQAVEVERMREALQVIKDMALIVRQLNQALIVKERKSKVELLEARRFLIKSLREWKWGGKIGIKKMGGLNIKPFRKAMKRKFPDEGEEKAVELWSFWESYCGDSSCHPIKIIADNKGLCKKIVDLEDATFKHLKEEYGEEAFNEVAIALSEMEYYRQSGGYTKLELWNFRENRKATLKEAIFRILKKWKKDKNKTK